MIWIWRSHNSHHKSQWDPNGIWGKGNSQPPMAPSGTKWHGKCRKPFADSSRPGDSSGCLCHSCASVGGTQRTQPDISCSGHIVTQIIKYGNGTVQISKEHHLHISTRCTPKVGIKSWYIMEHHLTTDRKISSLRSAPKAPKWKGVMAEGNDGSIHVSSNWCPSDFINELESQPHLDKGLRYLWSTYLSIYLPIYLSIYLPTYLSIYLSN